MRRAPADARGLEHPDRPNDVDVRVEVGFLDRVPDVDLGGEVEHDLGTRRGEDRRHGAGIGDVDHVQLSAAAERLVEIRLPAGRKVVDHGDSIAPGEQRVDHVRSDEAGAAGDQAVHSATQIRRLSERVPPEGWRARTAQSGTGPTEGRPW